MHHSKYLSVSGFLIGLLLATGCAGIAQEKSSVVPDAQVEANVLKALANTPQLADQSISTTTVYGQVTLTGNVRDEASRDMAETVTSNTPGVKKVIDQLAIGADADGTSGQDQSPSTAASDTGLQSDGTFSPNQEQAGPPSQENPGDTVAPPTGEAPNQSSENGPPEPPPSAYPPQYGAAGPPPQEGQNQPQGQYRAPYNPSYRQEPPSPSARPYPAQQGGEAVVVPSGTLLRVRVNQGMDSKNTVTGTVFDGTVINDVIAGNAVAIPRGTPVQGKVVDVHNAGSFKGRGELALQLTQITLGGQTYPVVSDAWSHQGADKSGQTVGNAIGLGAFGALIGAVAGGGPGALIGAGVGGAAGVGASAASGRGEAVVPPEAILNFRLTQQVPLVTVSQDEMNRLASGMQPMQRLRRRNPPPPPYYYYGPPYYPY